MSQGRHTKLYNDVKHGIVHRYKTCICLLKDLPCRPIIPCCAIHAKPPDAKRRWSSCYRREAGAAGKDTSGIIRVHQFDKVEMFVYAKQEDSYKEHEHLLAMEQEMLGKVEVPYRIIDTAAGDLGSSAARKFDCEAWVPTQGRYRELTSTSNCTEYQARRLNIRERMEDGGTRAVSTLNGTLATTRWLVAILENHQQKDGSIVIPQAMRAYMGGKEVIEPTKWEA